MERTHRLALAALTGALGGALLIRWLTRGLPSAVTRTVLLREGLHPTLPSLLHLPEGFDPYAPWSILVYYRGWNSCVQAIAGSAPQPCRPGGRPHQHSDVIGQVDRSQQNTILLMPEMPIEIATSDPGRLAQRDTFRRMLEELLREHVSPLVGRSLSLSDHPVVQIAAHSGGYRPAAASLRGDVPVRDVLLLDAFYGDAATYERYVTGGGRLISIFTGGDTMESSRALYDRFRAEPGVFWNTSTAMPTPAEWAARYLGHRTSYGHSLVPLHYLEPWLKTRSP